VTHNTGSAFFIPVIVGLHDAAKQVGWSATYTGPSGGVSVSEQVEVLNSVVENNPAAIGTSLMDDTSYDDVINRALDNDIPVAVWNTGSYTPQQMRDTFGQRLPFVGQNHVSAGYASGLTMAEKLSTNSPKVTIARCCSGFQYALKRAEGIRRGLSDALDNPEFTEVLEYGQQASEAVPTIESHFAANPNLDAVASVDAFAFFVSQAVQNTGNQDEITVGGADLIANTMEVIKDGTMAYSFGQDPYTQGHEPTMQMWRYLDRGVPPKDVDTAAEIVDESKVDWVQRRSNTWGNLREWHRND
jgi:ABC-type sugar transport system substrate-binding protein